MNPLALISFLSEGPNRIGSLFGATGHVSGISLYAGVMFGNAHSLELRFATGPASVVVWDTQIQFGYIWHPLQQFTDMDGGLSMGIMFRQFFWRNRITGYNIFNITPEFLLGWRFDQNPLLIDLRAGMNIASIAWSNIPHSKTSIGLLPFPYNINFNPGIAWQF